MTKGKEQQRWLRQRRFTCDRIYLCKISISTSRPPMKREGLSWSYSRIQSGSRNEISLLVSFSPIA